jgi:lipopolysaccharide biosynthesis glycosyltransferase
MDVSRINPDFTAITGKQIDFLNTVVKSKNSKNKVTKIDVTDIYERELGHGKNENAYCTPYTLLRLFADIVPNMPEKLLYLDIDMMAAKDISELYNTDIENYEYAAVREKYGSKIIRPDYINAGMLLMNLNKIKETGLLKKARELIKKRKLPFADQDAVFWSTTSKLLLPRKFNEQASFRRKDTVICHFCKRLMYKPYPHTENFKQWQIEGIHKELKCFRFDDDLNEYLEWKKKFELEEIKQ